MRSARIALAAAGTLAISTVWFVVGCPNRECEASGESEEVDVVLQGEAGTRTYLITVTADLDFVDSAGGEYTAFDQLDVSLWLDEVGGAGSVVHADLISDPDGDADDYAIYWPGEDPAVVLTASDLIHDCRWGDVCEFEVELELDWEDAEGEVQGTVSAKYSMSGDNQECKAGDFSGIVIDVTIEE